MCIAGITARLSPAALAALQTQQRQARTQELQARCRKAESRWAEKTGRGSTRLWDNYDSIKPDIVKLNVKKMSFLCYWKLLGALFQLPRRIWGPTPSPLLIAVSAMWSVSLCSLAAKRSFTRGRTSPSWPSFKGPSGNDSLCLHLASVSPLSILGGRETAELCYRMRGRQMGREFSSDCTAHLFGMKMTDTW